MERPLTANIQPGGEPLDLHAYEQRGGYAAARDAVRNLSPADVQTRVKDSGLRGRGGAGFPTGQKWSFVPMGAGAPHPKYLVVNADEMEPGTFKDRLLMEGDPHQLLEGVILSAYALEAEVAYIFLRWAYTLAAARIERAIAEAVEAHYLGADIFGSDYRLDVYLHVSAGRYICGEETALLNALEGKRGNPRSKPPFPAVSGLWGKPTVVNNVETICNVPHIVGKGVGWFKQLSLTDEGGTKLYGASGRVKRPGIWELPMGTPLREIVDEHAGGMHDGARLRGVLPGGASTDFLVEAHLDVPMDFASVEKAGSRLGTGTVIVLDDRTCPVGFVRNLEDFFAQESCGWCTPCWAGLHWIADTLRDLEEGAGQPDDLDRLASHARLLAPGHTYCALAPGAAEPLSSALEYFRDDFDRHVREHRCPWR
ncbi:MAG TPA: NADH-quinone oxidoreductase subunit NuoF [Vicinamibacterales bacterium]|jgi:NADH-quinone oxidoreductase subunit F|nr:NADH-quinone oxidoreductase subunit NuoF [Vicinamibacterales bacterium]